MDWTRLGRCEPRDSRVLLEWIGLDSVVVNPVTPES